MYLFVRRDKLPDFFQSQIEGEAVHVLFHPACRGGAHADQILIRSLVAVRSRHRTAVVLLDHGHGSAHQVAQVIGKIVIQAVQHDFICIESVLAEGVFSQQEVLQGGDAVALNELYRVHNVASGL